MFGRILLIAASLFLFGDNLLFANDVADLVKKSQPSIATVIGYDENNKPVKFGTGFFADKEGNLITNYHVLTDISSASIKASNSKTYPISGIIAENKEMDLAKVSVIIPKSYSVPLKTDSELPNSGERIVVIGSPMGLEYTVSEGIISAIRDLPNVGTIFQISAPISAGSSGSPVMNMNGNVVGIASFQLLRGQNLNFAIPSKYVYSLKKLEKIKPISQSDDSEKSGDIRKKQAQIIKPDFIPQPEEKTEEVILIHLDKGEVIKTDRVWEESGMVKFLRHGVEMGYPKSRIKKIEKTAVKIENDGITKDYVKPKDSKHSEKSKTGVYEIWSNYKTWRSGSNDSGAEFMFKHESEESRAFSGVDGATRSGSELSESIIADMKCDGLKPKIAYSDKRMVNGKEMLCLEIKAKIKERPVIYFGYFWSGNAGTVHFFSVTEEAVFDKYKKDIVELLNGLVIKRD